MPGVNEQVIDALTVTNVKAVAEAPAESAALLSKMMASAAGLAIQNAVSNQQHMNAIQQAVTTQAVNKLLNIDPTEAIALVKANTGDDIAAQMQSLLAALNSGQQGTKAAQTTPPVTSPPPAT